MRRQILQILSTSFILYSSRIDFRNFRASLVLERQDTFARNLDISIEQNQSLTITKARIL